MNALYFVPALAVLGLSVYADGEEDVLQTWIDYVNEYRQYMEEYRRWASDRFGYYESQIGELTDQLDEKNKHIHEIEETIDQNDRYIQNLEDRINEILEENEQLVNINGERETTPSDDASTRSGTTGPDPRGKYYITTDKQTYMMGDTATITGKTNSRFGATVMINNPDNGIISIEPLIPEADGTFETAFLFHGPMVEYGTYTARVSIGDSEARAQFELIPESDSDTQENHIKTDKQSYHFGEQIQVTGKTDSETVTLRLTGPGGDATTIQQLIPNIDGTFETTHYLAEKDYGTYTVDTLASDSVEGAQFELIREIAHEQSVSVGDHSRDIGYTGTNVSIVSVDTDTDFISLIFSLDVTSDGTLEITFPRDVLDSEIDGEDGSFIMIADGAEVDYTETETTLTRRTLSINLDAGTEKLEIIGTALFE